MKVDIDEKRLVQVCKESRTAAEAARKLGLHFNTFKRYALMYNCYFTNKSHKGVKTGERSGRIKTNDILDGKYPDYSTFKLKLRLIREGYKEDKCEICGWNKKRIGDEFSPCELHHIDGDSRNHRLENLIIICPNCHSLTDNYRSKNRAHGTEMSDVDVG